VQANARYKEDGTPSQLGKWVGGLATNGLAAHRAWEARNAWGGILRDAIDWLLLRTEPEWEQGGASDLDRGEWHEEILFLGRREGSWRG